MGEQLALPAVAYDALGAWYDVRTRTPVVGTTVLFIFRDEVPGAWRSLIVQVRDASLSPRLEYWTPIPALPAEATP